MAKEIERKFLVVNDDWKSLATKKIKIIQGYLANTERGSIRIRLSDDSANLNIKSMTMGVTRSEFEYPVPVEEAKQILENLCIQPVIEKTRYHIEQDRHVWEVDVFEGANSGLVVAEIELGDAGEEFHLPDWIGEEVSGDPRYYNVCLVEHPYNQW